MIHFGETMDGQIPLVKFSHNNNYYASIKDVPFEALYGRKYRFLVSRIEVGDTHLARNHAGNNLLTSQNIVQKTTKKFI